MTRLPGIMGRVGWTTVTRVFALVAVVVVPLLSVAACGAPADPYQPSAAHYGQGALKEFRCITTGAGRQCWGLVPADRGLSDEIRLQKTRVVAGATIEGTLTVTNRDRHPVDLLYRGCRPSYGVAMTNGSAWTSPLFILPCNPHPLVMEPRANKFPVSVVTSYNECMPRGVPLQGGRRCVGRDGTTPPPLPPGKYWVVLVGLTLALPPSPPVLVTLT